MRALLQRLLQRESRPEPPAEPLSMPGTSATHGWLERLGEYNPKVAGTEFFRVVEQMRNNSRVIALEYLLTLPIISTHWEVRPLAGASATSVEAATLLNADLFASAEKTLHDLLRIGVLARLYGVRFLEPIWLVEDGRVRLRDYVDIHPLTYHRFNFDERGNLSSVVQRVGTLNKLSSVEIEIPVDRLLRFTWREEGGNPLGYSDLRSLYPDWYRLEFLYNVLQISAERAGIGAWQAKLPRDLWDNDVFRGAIADTLRRLRTHESGAIVVPSDISIEVLRAVEEQGLNSILRMIEHYETNLAAGMLANVLQVGMRDVGTQALASVLYDMFLYQLNQTAKWLADAINRQLVRKWLRYNYPSLSVEQYPRLYHTDLRLLLKREAVINALSQVVHAGVVTPDEGVEAYVRDLLTLPPARQPTVEPPAPSPDEVGLHRERVTLQREPRVRSEAEFRRAMLKYLAEVESTVTPLVESALSRVSDAPSQDARAAAIEALATIELPPTSTYAAIVVAPALQGG